MEHHPRDFTISRYLSKAISYDMSENFAGAIKLFCYGCGIDHKDQFGHMCKTLSLANQVEEVFHHLIEISDYGRILDMFKFHLSQQEGRVFVPKKFFQLMYIKNNLTNSKSFLRGQVLKDILDILDN